MRRDTCQHPVEWELTPRGKVGREQNKRTSYPIKAPGARVPVHQRVTGVNGRALLSGLRKPRHTGPLYARGGSKTSCSWAWGRASGLEPAGTESVDNAKRAWIWEHVPQGRTKEALGMQKGGEAEL